MLREDQQLNRHNYYEATATRPPALPRLQGTVHADVVVVGAGFAGLSTALELAQRGYKVVVLEAQRVCSGASGRNGGQVIVGYASGQAPWEAQLGLQDARRAWELSLQAVNLVEQRVQQHALDCDWVRGYLHVADSKRKARSLLQEAQDLQHRYGFATEIATGGEVARFIDSPRYCAASFEAVSGHLHPLKYGLGLLRAAQACGVQVFEHTPVRSVQRGPGVVASTEHGEVRAAFGVLAGNCSLQEYGPALAPELASRIMPVGTYIVATAPLPQDVCDRLIARRAAVCDNNFVLDYFRISADRRLLFGGRVSYSGRTPGALQAVMAQRMAEVFPQLRGVGIDYVWGGFVDISMNRAPDFGRLGHTLYYLQGFSGHGVALTGLAGQMVAKAIAGQAEQFDLFARLQHRKFPGGPLLRTPTLVLGMLYHRLQDWW